MLQANRHLQAGHQDLAYIIIKELLNEEAIYIKFEMANEGGLTSTQASGLAEN